MRTDHPVPDLPFVDDAHIPIDDPFEVESVGRGRHGGMWGREDRVIVNGEAAGWIAFTTDPARRDLAWCVRWHPEHGRSVVLYRNDDASSVHMAWWGPALLFRSGGYWWDGTTWYRPSQVWDAPREDYFNREVPAAVTVSAADLLAAGADSARGQILRVQDVAVPPAAPDDWLNDLALWASQRPQDARPLSSCVVSLGAPELTGNQLVGVAETAEIAGIAGSTLRAYIARGENSVPLPQAKVSGRQVWARPVAQEWAEQRQRSPEAVAAALAGPDENDSQPPGVREVWARFSTTFFSLLWERPDRRKRWALRWRTEDAVREVADGLGWEVAASLDRIVPIHDLRITIEHAILDELAFGQQLDRSIAAREDADPVDDLDDDLPGLLEHARDPQFYGITKSVTKTLDWLIRVKPSSAQYTIGAIIGEADRRFGIPRHVTENSIRTALGLDSDLDSATLDNFLSRVFSPDNGA